MKRIETSKNIYVPLNGRIEGIIEQARDIKLFRVRVEQPIECRPGQFFMISVWGAGEAPISAASLPDDKGQIELCVRKAGMVTNAIHSLQEGGKISVRGPYGNGFPLEIPEGRDVLLVAGGIGMAALRSLIQWLIKNRNGGNGVTLLYGARAPDDILFKEEMDDWTKKGIKILLTVDSGGNGWKGYVGLVTGLLHEVHADFKQAAAYICGPEVMIKASMMKLSSLGMADDNIIATLEAYMKCGIGKCGHCYFGAKYICTDGPVFSYKEIKEIELMQMQ